MNTKSIVFALVVLLTGFQSFAQEKEKGRRHERPNNEKHLAKMKQELNLSAEQEAKIKQIFEENKTKHQDVKEKRKAEMESFKAETDAKINSVLNEEQKSKFDKIKAERKANRKEKMEKWKAKHEERRANKEAKKAESAK